MPELPGRADVIINGKPDRDPREGNQGRQRKNRGGRSTAIAAAVELDDMTRRIRSGVVPGTDPRRSHIDPSIGVLSPEHQAALTAEAMEDGLVDLDKAEAPLSEEEAEKRERRRRRRKTVAAIEATAVAAGLVAAGIAAVDSHPQPIDHLQPIPGPFDDIVIGDINYGNMIYAEDLEAHALPVELQKQIGAAIIPVQIHAGPDQPLSHHEIAGIVVAGTDGNPYLVTINPAQGEYDYYVNGKIVSPDYQGGKGDNNGIAVIPTDAENDSSMLRLAEGGLPSSTEVLHLVTFFDGKLTFTEVLVGDDQDGNPIIFAPPQDEQLPGELGGWDLLLPATRGGFVVNDKGEVLGFFGDAEVIPYQVPGADPNNPELLFSLTGTLEPVTKVRPPDNNRPELM